VYYYVILYAAIGEINNDDNDIIVLKHMSTNHLVTLTWHWYW